MKKNTRQSIIFVLFVFVLLASFLLEESYDETIPMGEVIGPDENKTMAVAIASSLNMVNNTRNNVINDQDNDETASSVPYRRDVHIKSHGCVKARFTVHDVESNYRWGVLSKPREYPAWIRYSSGDPSLLPDRKRDARGMAIKLMNVDGEKLLAAQKHARRTALSTRSISAHRHPNWSPRAILNSPQNP